MFSKGATKSGSMQRTNTWKAGEPTDTDMIDDMLKSIPAEEMGSPARSNRGQQIKPLQDEESDSVESDGELQKERAALAEERARCAELTAKNADL